MINDGVTNVQINNQVYILFKQLITLICLFTISTTSHAQSCITSTTSCSLKWNGSVCRNLTLLPRNASQTHNLVWLSVKTYQLTLTWGTRETETQTFFWIDVIYAVNKIIWRKEWTISFIRINDIFNEKYPCKEKKGKFCRGLFLKFNPGEHQPFACKGEITNHQLRYSVQKSKENTSLVFIS